MCNIDALELQVLAARFTDCKYNILLALITILVRDDNGKFIAR